MPQSRLRKFAFIVAFGVSPAAAQEYKPPHWIVHNPDASSAIVWKDSAAQDKGLSFLLSGASKNHPELLSGLISCIVPNETPLVLNESGFLSATITVIDGKYTGCNDVMSTHPMELIP